MAVQCQYWHARTIPALADKGMPLLCVGPILVCLSKVILISLHTVEDLRLARMGIQDAVHNNTAHMGSEEASTAVFVECNSVLIFF